VQPRRAPGVLFRETIVLGELHLNKADTRALVAALAREWPGNRYHPLTRNCNDFSRELVGMLVPTATFPAWLNRLAWLGACNVAWCGV
jgi:hypothetical protein